MSDLFGLSMPWWEFVLRAAVVYLVLLVLVRLSGKRTVGQYTPFDMILVVLVGNAVQNSMIGEDYSLLGGLVLVTTLIGLNWLVGVVSARNRAVERLVAGEAVLLARDGEAYARVLRRHHISDNEFLEAMHEAGCTGVHEVRQAVLETDGRISIVKCQPGGDQPPPHANKVG